MIRRLLFEEFKSIYNKVPRLKVEPIIQTLNGILLTKRDIETERGLYHITGNTILKVETVKQANK